MVFRKVLIAIGMSAVCAAAAQAQGKKEAWQPAIEQKVVPSKWNYISRKDEMRGTEIPTAYLMSTKLIPSRYSFRGPSTVTLGLTKREGKTQIWLNIDNGQLTCYETYVSEIKAKFDSGAIQDFGCARSASGLNETIFVQQAPRFLNALRASKKLIVEVTIFGAGSQQIPFETAGLAWK